MRLIEKGQPGRFYDLDFSVISGFSLIPCGFPPDSLKPSFFFTWPEEFKGCLDVNFSPAP
ncbi:hypothetical protein ES703_23753 [subsurface metagenome]